MVIVGDGRFISLDLRIFISYFIEFGFPFYLLFKL